jgi:hypothetical protein
MKIRRRRNSTAITLPVCRALPFAMIAIGAADRIVNERKGLYVLSVTAPSSLRSGRSFTAAVPALIWS